MNIDCPFCCSLVPREQIGLRGDFACPSCGKMIRLKRSFEVGIRISTVMLGLSFAYAAGFRGPLVMAGLILAPFLLWPVWRTLRTFLPIKLMPSQGDFTRLDL